MSVIETKLFPFVLASLLFCLVVITTTNNAQLALEYQIFWLSSYFSISVFVAIYGVLLSIRRTSWLLLSLSSFFLLIPIFNLVLFETSQHMVTLPLFLLLEELQLVVSWLIALSFVSGAGRLVSANIRKVKMLRWNAWLMTALIVASGIHCAMFYGVGWRQIGSELPMVVLSIYSLLCVFTLLVFDNDYEPIALHAALYLSAVCFWTVDLQLVAPFSVSSQLLMTFIVVNLFIFALRSHEQVQVQKLVVNLRNKKSKSPEYETNLLIDAVGHLSSLKQPYSLVVFEIVFSGMLKQVLTSSQQHIAIRTALNNLNRYLQAHARLFRFKPPKDNAGESRFYSRAGEDTYAVILAGEQDKDLLQQFVVNMQEIIASPLTVGQHSFKLHCAFSAIQFPALQASASRMLTLAKRGLGQAEQSVGRYFLYGPNQAGSHTVHWQLVVDLQRAIETEAIQIVHQPQIDLQTHKPIGNEALLRWHHDQFGFINPELVVKLAEENNLINALTHLVISKAMTQLAIMWRRGYKERMSINVSAHDLLRPSFLPELKRISSCTGVTLDHITIELTESAAMEDFDQAQTIFSDLRTLGIQVAIDDFGTGYSSLSTLAHLPFNELKVDKQFVCNIASSNKNQSITQSIIDLANHLDAHVVAEGVDSPITEQWLSKIGCQYGQGYLYAKGMHLEDYLEWRNKQQLDNSVDFLQSRRKVVAK